MKLALACVTALALTGCMRWHEVGVTPEQALAGSQPRDVLVVLASDSAHWYSLPQAQIVADSIVGHRKMHGQLLRLTVPIDEVTRMAVREPNQEANAALKQVGLFAGILTIAVLGPIALAAFWGR